MRLYAIPIVKNRWAYYCHSTLPSTSRLAKAVDWSSKKWELLDKAEADSWKKKLYIRGNNVMNQLDYQEWFFKSVPGKEDIEKPLNQVMVHHPSLLDGSQLELELKALLKQRIPYHNKYMWYSAYWVPLSCTFVVVPLIPNIPLAYNLFRLYSHYKAWKGAQHLGSLSSYGSLDYISDGHLDVIFDKKILVSAQDVVFPPEIHEAFEKSPKKPDLVAMEQDIEGVLNQDNIKQLVDALQVPGLEMELNRARSQILKSIAEERFKGQVQHEK
ncbi:mitochondrial K+-H+ exchange-related-domain-containing protein [Parasitella parasitica]|nr:mitochondrial K+-H+ exchange-related-domain-containing protein [Parasitella parasitica]